MSFTKQQLEAINCDLNCTVSAGAGSGKTTVLSLRFLRLVKEKGIDCNRILTITFTKKATAEMKERIYSLLVKEKLEDQIEKFSNAYISTVDGFCLEIARKDCRCFGYSPDFGIADEYDVEKQLQNMAQMYVLEESSKKGFVFSALEHQSVEDLVRTLVMAALNTDVVHGFNGQKFSENQYKLAESSFADAEEKLANAVEEYVERLGSEEKLAANVSILQSYLDGLIGFEEIVFDKKQGSAAVKDVAKELKGNIQVALEKIKLYKSVIDSREFSDSYYEFVEKFVKKTVDYKISKGIAGFSDVMQMALSILENNKAVRTEFKNKFDYIMVDEFQDNNDDYRKLIYLLAERRDCFAEGVPEVENLEKNKIFLVGDEKQSIYRFRGADVSVFKRLIKEIELSGGVNIELDTNFRSTPDLVCKFSELFSRVMENNSEEYEAQFRELKYNEERNPKIRSRIVYHNFYHEKNADLSQYGDCEMANSGQSEAYGLAGLIKEIVSDDSWMIEDRNGNLHHPSYNDIAILMRTSSHQALIEKALKLQSIPYTLAETKALMTEALVNDFYSLLSVSVYPFDSISRAAWLKSPLCNTKDKDMVSKFETEIPNIPTYNIPSAVRYIWYNLGYRNFIISNPSNQVYIEHYNWLYSLACDFEKNGKTIVEFLDYLRPLIGTSDKLKELTVFNEEAQGVSIMTIHKSKGLEFPVVIIASMETESNFGKTEKALREGDFVYLASSLAPDGKIFNFYQEFYKEKEKSQELAELKRLFYVAATRAENHLVFSAAPTVYKNNSERMSLAELLTAACPYDIQNCEFINEKNTSCPIESIPFSLIKAEQTYSVGKLNKSRIDSVSPFYESFTKDEFDYSSHTQSVTENLETDTENVHLPVLPSVPSDSRIREENLQTEFGTLVHALIQQRISLIPVAVSENLEFCFEDARKLAENFIQSPFFKKITGMDLYCERAFEMVDNTTGNLVSGIIDLMAENDSEVVIYDFKTDILLNPERHAYQLETYAKAVKQMYPDKKISAYIIYLRDPDSSVKMV